MFAVSYGMNSIQNGTTVNRNSATNPPAVLTHVPPGYYTISMMDVTTPYLLWLKTNIPSTGRGGSLVVQYEGPNPEPGRTHSFAITLWRQPRRMSPPPKGPRDRAVFNLNVFAEKYALVQMATVGFKSK